MPYIIEKKQRNSKLKRNLKAAKRAGAVSFDQNHKLIHQPDDELMVRADRKSKSDRNSRPGRKPVSTVDRIKAQGRFHKRGGLPPRLHMTTPKAKEMEKKLHGADSYRENSIFSSELFGLNEELSEAKKRWLSDIMGRFEKSRSARKRK